MAKAAWLPRCARAAGVILIPILLLLPEARALAQGDQADHGQAEAVEFYRRGREHFEAGRYREAISDLEEAVSLDPNSPTLVYNVARVYELLGELAKAIQYYNMYLRMLSDTTEEDERTRVADTIARLEGARDQVGATPDAPDPGDAQIDRPVIVQRHGVADAAFWVTAAGAAAVLVAGGILGAVALLNDGNADCVVGDMCTLQERDDFAATAVNLALAADVLLITGGVAALTAALLYALRTRDVETYPRYQGVSAFVGTDGRGAFFGARGTF